MLLEEYPDIGVNPDYPISTTASSKVKTVTLGDGYEQTTPNGINYKSLTWTFSYTGLYPEEYEVLFSFLSEHLNAFPFLWTHPVTGTTYKVKCTNVGDAYVFHGGYTLNVTLEQVN